MTTGVKAGVKSFVLLKRNMVNLIFRLLGGRPGRKVGYWDGRQTNAGASQGRSVIERIRVDITPPRKRADFQ